MEPGATMGATPFTSKPNKHRSKTIFSSCSPKLPTGKTPDANIRPRQLLLTNWLKDEQKIGSNPYRYGAKRNPNPLIPPCGPKPASRKLFDLQDSREDFLKITEATSLLQKTAPEAPSPAPPVVPSSADSEIITNA